MSDREYGFWGSLGRVFIGHFVFCSFLGLVTVKALVEFAESLGLQAELLHMLTIAVVTGLTVAVVVWLIHLGKVRRLNPYVYQGNDRAYRRASVGSAFACGVLVILAHKSLLGLVVLTGLTILAITLSIKLFFRRIARLIRPGQYAHIRDVMFLIGVFTTLLIAFTLVNFSIDLIYSEIAQSPHWETTGEAFTSTQEARRPDEPPLSLLDYLYFSVVVMTTLGFGDISPIKPAAKILVGMQCVTSYVMFALMVGLITRGLIFKDDEEGGER